MWWELNTFFKMIIIISHCVHMWLNEHTCRDQQTAMTLTCGVIICYQLQWPLASSLPVVSRGQTNLCASHLSKLALNNRNINKRLARKLVWPCETTPSGGFLEVPKLGDNYMYTHGQLFNASEFQLVIIWNNNYLCQTRNQLPIIIVV